MLGIWTFCEAKLLKINLEFKSRKNCFTSIIGWKEQFREKNSTEICQYDQTVSGREVSRRLHEHFVEKQSNHTTCPYTALSKSKCNFLCHQLHLHLQFISPASFKTFLSIISSLMPLLKYICSVLCSYPVSSFHIHILAQHFIIILVFACHIHILSYYTHKQNCQTSANGGVPVTISITVQPNDQMSAC